MMVKQRSKKSSLIKTLSLFLVLFSLFSIVSNTSTIDAYAEEAFLKAKDWSQGGKWVNFWATGSSDKSIFSPTSIPGEVGTGHIRFTINGKTAGQTDPVNIKWSLNHLKVGAESNGKEHVAYCISPFVSRWWGHRGANKKVWAGEKESQYGYYDSNIMWDKMDGPTKNKLWLAAYYGYGYNGQNSEEYYIATQMVMWESVNWSVISAKSRGYTDSKGKRQTLATNQTLTATSIKAGKQHANFKPANINKYKTDILNRIKSAGVVEYVNSSGTKISNQDIGMGKDTVIRLKTAVNWNDYVLSSSSNVVVVSKTSNTITVRGNSRGNGWISMIHNGKNNPKVDFSRTTRVWVDRQNTSQELLTMGKPVAIQLNLKVVPATVNLMKTDETGKAVPGVKFQISYRSDFSRGGNTWEYTTNAQGKISTSGWKVQKIYYRETSVPVGLVIDRTVKSLDLVPGNNPEVKVANKLVRGVATITKTGEGGELLQGTVYDVLNSSGKVVETITTGSNGKATTSRLLMGNYSFVEKSVRAPYHINTTPIKFTLTATAANSEPNKDVIANSSQTNKKSVGNVVVSKRGINKSLTTDDTVVGAEFFVVEKVGNDWVKIKNPNPITKSDNPKALASDLPYIYKSDSTGKFTINNIKLSYSDKFGSARFEYGYQETWTPSPYRLDSARKTFYIDWKNPNNPIESNNRVMNNDVSLSLAGDSYIIKYSKNPTTGAEAPAAGVVFQITSVKTGKVVRTTKPSDKDGKAFYEPLEVGDYKVKEISAPPHLIMKGEVKDLKITYTDMNNPSSPSVVKFVNEFGKVGLVGVESILIDTKKSSEGLDVKYKLYFEKYFDKNNLTPHWDDEVQVSIYQKGTTTPITSMRMTLGALYNETNGKGVTGEKLFKIPSSMLDKDKEYSFLMDVKPVNNHANDVRGGLETKGYTSSEAVIDLEARDVLYNTYKREIQTFIQYGKSMTKKYETITVEYSYLQPQRTGYGFEYPVVIKYNNELARKQKEIKTVLHLPADMSDVTQESGSFKEYELEQTISHSNPLYVNTIHFFKLPETRVEKVTGNVYQSNAVDTQEKKDALGIKNEMVAGGNKIYVPIWSDVKDYKINAVVSEVGENAISFNIINYLSVYAQMITAQDSGSVDLDNINVYPIDRAEFCSVKTSTTAEIEEFCAESSR